LRYLGALRILLIDKNILVHECLNALTLFDAGISTSVFFIVTELKAAIQVLALHVAAIVS
jgi:hypothetical protein